MTPSDPASDPDACGPGQRTAGDTRQISTCPSELSNARSNLTGKA